MRILVIFLIGLLPPNVFAVGCVYPDKQQGELVARDDCGDLNAQSELAVSASLLADIAFDHRGLACLLIELDSSYAAYYLNPEGTSRKTLFFDNGCDYFAAGLARTSIDGKIAYFNPSLTIEIETKFDNGEPFYYQHAVVCSGPFEEEQQGEHTLLRGGQCGLIDRQGQLVVPAAYAIEDRDAFIQYINSHNECQPPPVTTSEAALCHAKRHARHLEYHSDDWAWYRIRKAGNVWYIDFIQTQEPDTRLRLELDAASAQWQSIIPLEDSN